MKYTQYLFFLMLIFTFNSCSVYNFTGTGKIDAKTFQVNYFQNISELVEPGIDRDFTLKLQDIVQNQTNLNATTSNADLVYEGEIVEYRFSAMSATSENTAAQTRLSITVNVRFSNKNKPEEDFEKRFSHFDDFDGTQQATGAQLKKSLDIIFERITQDIFNGTLAKW
ncbi:LptE family protein [Flavobacterium sp.]|uniref:LptE family protein n=1 Tax=Flavobacterium sp. TaxID=239 RepID=UPI00286D6F9D|nr:LptE family protein [Flavobacterium sp.]